MLAAVRSVVRVSAMLLASSALLLVRPTVANAQNDSPQGTQAIPLAESLFLEGRALADRGDYEGACAKFEASFRLDTRAIGTLLNIATCKENTGKLATAWGLYREVSVRSRGVRNDRVAIADEREKAIAPKLSKVVLQVPSKESAQPGLAIKIDGLVIAEAAWSSELPLDGGEHTLEVSAPGFVTQRSSFKLAAEKQRLAIPIPSLTREPEPIAFTPNESQTQNKSARNFGILLAGVGVAALGVGGVFGIDVLTRSDSPNAACPDPCVRGSDGATESERRYDALKREALLANILLPVGAVATLGGAYLWFVVGAPSNGAKPTSSAVARPYLTPGGAGVVGRF